MIHIYQERLQAKKDQYHQEIGKKQNLELRLSEVSQKLSAAKEESEVLEDTRLILQRAGMQAREAARKRLEDTVTDALRYIFGPDFSFVIDMKEARGRTEAEFYVESTYNGERVRTKPQDARGGGVVDIISIALRLALIQIHQHPKIQGPIILDEPGKHVSADYTAKLALFLKQMSQVFNRQIILSTHQPDLANIADTSHTVEIRGGHSVVTDTQS